MKRFLSAAIIILFTISGNVWGAEKGGFEGHYFKTADDAIITFTYQDFHLMLDRLRDQQLGEYKQMFNDWKAHMPGGPIQVRVLEEYEDGILKVHSIEGGFDFFIFRDYLLAEF